VTSTRTYLWTLLGLLALSALTFGMSYIELGGFSVVIAMAIAAAKAWLVAMFFMHLGEHGTSDKAALLLGVLLALLLIGFAAADIATRAAVPLPPV
jgi:cytochrome c oxidase subunit 4